MTSYKIFWLLATLMCLSPGASPAVFAAKVPTDWYVVPERAQDFNISKLTDDEDDLEEAVDELFTAQGDSFDEMLQQSHFGKESLSGWSLSVIKGDVGISAGGDIGILALKGKIAVETHWYPRNQGRKADSDKYHIQDSEADLEISQLSSPSEIQEKVKRIVDAAYYSGKVWDPVRMEMELLSAVNHVGKMMQNPPDTRYFMWTPSKFRLEVSVSAEGKVLPFMSVGGDIRVRIDWKILPGNYTKEALDNESARSFRELVLILADELRYVSSGHAGYRSDTVEIALGMTASGKIGIAKTSFGIVGKLFFKVNHGLSLNSANESESTYAPLLVITDTSYGGILPKGDGSFIQPVSREALWLNPGMKGEVYEINRAQLRYGLKKAHDMAGFFVGRAQRNSQRYWYLKKFKTAYEMSIGGSLSLASLSGKVGVSIIYAAQ